MDIWHGFPCFFEPPWTLIKFSVSNLYTGSITNDVVLTALLHLFATEICCCTMPIYSWHFYFSDKTEQLHLVQNIKTFASGIRLSQLFRWYDILVKVRKIYDKSIVNVMLIHRGKYVIQPFQDYLHFKTILNLLF